MAECIMNRLEQGAFQAYSAGSHPSGAVHPYVIQLLQNYNYPTEQLRSKSWHEFSGPDALPLDFVFTLCDDAAQDTCPEWSGQPMATHWGLPDPAAAEGTEGEKRFAFLDTMRMLMHRIDIFVSFPIDTLTRMSLQKRLDAIGKTTPQAAQP
jgi:protein-tyrosine-phosphatase